MFLGKKKGRKNEKAEKSFGKTKMLCHDVMPVKLFYASGTFPRRLNEPTRNKIKVTKVDTFT